MTFSSEPYQQMKQSKGKSYPCKLSNNLSDICLYYQVRQNQFPLQPTCNWLNESLEWEIRLCREEEELVKDQPFPRMPTFSPCLYNWTFGWSPSWESLRKNHRVLLKLIWAWWRRFSKVRKPKYQVSLMLQVLLGTPDHEFPPDAQVNWQQHHRYHQASATVDSGM